MLTLLTVVFVLAATVFVGDILLMLIWKLSAERTREPRVALFALRTVMTTDTVLLGPSAMLTAISGNLLGPQLGVNIYATPALSIAMGSFILSGLVWSLFLIPAQKKQLKMCTELGTNRELPDQYFQLAARWQTWGYVAAALVLVAVILVAAS